VGAAGDLEDEAMADTASLIFFFFDFLAGACVESLLSLSSSLDPAASFTVSRLD